MPPDQFVYYILFYLLPALLLPINMYPRFHKRSVVVAFQFFPSGVGVGGGDQYDLEFAPVKIIPDDDLVSVAREVCLRFRDENLGICFELREYDGGCHRR